MDKQLRSCLLFLGILLPSLLLIAYYFADIRAPLFSDPHIARTDPLTEARWDAIFEEFSSSATAPVPWKAPRVVTEEDFQFDDTPAGFSINYDRSSEDEGTWMPAETETLYVPKETQSATLPTGEQISLKTIATGYQTGENCYENRSFDALTLKQIEPSILDNTDIRLSGPAFLARFRTSSYLHYPKTVRIFNRETHMQIGKYPWLYAEKKKRLDVTATLTQWHPSPLYYVLDVDGGNESHSTFPIEVGQKIKTAPATIQLVFAKEFSGKCITTSYPSPFESQQKQIMLNRVKGSEGTSTVMGFVVTERRWLPQYINFQPSTDKVRWGLSVSGEDILENFFLVKFPVSKAKIGSLKISWPKASYRLIFELDTLPGLPPENSDLDNLFEAQIPNRPIDRSHVERDWDWISRTAHLQNEGFLPTSRQSSLYPKFENRTLGEIALDQKRQANCFSVKATQDHQLITQQRPPWAPWVDSFKSRLP